ncbi:calponin [Mucor velutinosus]|uniref:Calponin n=1 Tax=Mucor velutinosus TaxID=708070 RepID=A0AAN7DKV6_9FUNG|nr:calponin [Mucor velutinosus]
MEVDVRENIGRLIKDLTETGEWVLDAQKLKNLKSICKRSDALVQVAFEFIMAQLRKKHAQIRYSCVQLTEQLFDRSKYFRDLLTEDFPLFTQLTVGIQGKKLPPPAPVATKLKDYAIALIKAWFTKYGERYRQLGIAYDFLLDNGFLDRETGSLTTIHMDERNKSNTDARRKAIQFNRFEILKADMNDHLDIIKDNLTNMEGCFEILIPKNVFQGEDLDFDALLRGEASNSDPSAAENYKDSILSHGLGSNRYQITIDMSEESLMEDVEETQDNKIVFDQLREAYTLLETKHINQLNQWINTLVKMDLADKAEKEKWIKQVINLKGEASEAIRKAKLLKIEPTHKPVKRIDTSHMEEEEEDDEFGDELFEDVNVDKINAEERDKRTVSGSKLPPLQRLFPLSYDPAMMEDATYKGPPSLIEDTVNVPKDKGKQKANPEKEELYKRAPVVEWGEDLYYWDKTNVQFNTSGIEKSHRFMGTGEGTNEMPEHLLEELRKRPIYYKSEAPKEIQACRHPLHNGGLCPRKDLVTCPFHGKIIPRDDLGRPLNPEDVLASTSGAMAPVDPNEEYTGQMASRKPDAAIMNNLWQVLENDVMGQSGHETIANSRGRKRESATTGGSRKKQKQKSALIDVRKKPDTSYTRLTRQISTAKNRKLVEEAIEYEREMKSRNKEANNWR